MVLGYVLTIEVPVNVTPVFACFVCRSRREAELGELQRLVEEDTRRHEAQLSEMRVKHSAAIDSLQEQLDNTKRVSVCF